MWLANELGCLNVDEMLDQMSPEQFRERFAYWLLTDQRDPRRRHAELIAEIHNTITRYVAAKNGRQPTKSNLLTADQLIVPLYGGEEPKSMLDVESVDPDQLAKSLGCI